MKLRVVRDHGEHRKGDVIDMSEAEAHEALHEGWVKHEARNPVASRETR